MHYEKAQKTKLHIACIEGELNHLLADPTATFTISDCGSFSENSERWAGGEGPQSSIELHLSSEPWAPPKRLASPKMKTGQITASAASTQGIYARFFAIASIFVSAILWPRRVAASSLAE